MLLKYLLVLLMAFAVPTAEAFSFKESWESFKTYINTSWTWQKTAVVTGLAGITAAVLLYLKGRKENASQNGKGSLPDSPAGSSDGQEAGPSNQARSEIDSIVREAMKNAIPALRKFNLIPNKGMSEQQATVAEVLGQINRHFYRRGYMPINLDAYRNRLKGYVFFEGGLKGTWDGLRATRTELSQDERKMLAGDYKIHLMPVLPQGLPDYYRFVALVAKTIQGNDQLRAYVNNYKFDMDPLAPEKPGALVHPLAVIYVGGGKSRAQVVLNELYGALKGVKGSGKKPRFNAKVNDLIWIAQGNSDDKLLYLDNNLHWDPSFVYYNNSFPSDDGSYDHRLKHPETGAFIEDEVCALSEPVAASSNQ